MRNATMVFEVIMFSETCPSEKSSLGIFQSKDSAQACIEREKREYTDNNVFEIETKYLWTE